MFTQLYEYRNGAPIGSLSIDAVYTYNIRYQILCQTEEEHDYLSALQLMYGREVQVDIWSKWKRKRLVQYHLLAHNPEAPRTGSLAPLNKLLPIVFTTFDAGDSLRGL